MDERARKLMKIDRISRRIQGFELVWITDGAAWKESKELLNQCFNSMRHVYSLHDLEKGAFFNLF